jgi:hypothetical protein
MEEAMQQGYDEGWLVREFQLNHWLTGSPIYNATFDYWDAAIDGWTATNVALARVQDTDAVTTHLLPGQNVAKLGGSGSAGTLDLDGIYEPFLTDFHGHSVKIHAWMYSTAATAIRARLMVDGTAVSSTAYHSGNSTWEVVSSSDYSIAGGATQIGIQIQGDSAVTSGTHYVGAVWLEGGPLVREYPFPIRLAPDGPKDVYVTSPIAVDNNVADVRLHNPVPLHGWRVYRYRHEQGGGATEVGVLNFMGAVPSSMRRMWMPVSAPLTLPADDAENIEVSRPDDLLIAKSAALKLVEKELYGSSEIDQRNWASWMGRVQQDISEMKGGKGSSIGAVVLPRWV